MYVTIETNQFLNHGACGRLLVYPDVDVEKFAALDNTEKRKKFVFLQNLLK